MDEELIWASVKKVICTDIAAFDNEILTKAKNNDFSAIFRIGRLYEQGRKVIKDDEKAVEIFSICDKYGFIDGSIRLADKLFRGKGIKKDINKSKLLLLKGMKHNKINAFILMGDINYKESKLSEALKNYIKAEKLFYVDNQNVNEYIMALMYDNMSRIYLIDNNTVYNPIKATDYTDRALKEDVFCNSKNIGDLYFYGIGVQQDYSKAEKYYTRIAEEKVCDKCSGNCNGYCKEMLDKIWTKELQNKINK